VDRRAVVGLALSTGTMTASTFGTLGFAALAPLERDAFDLSTLQVGSLTTLVFLGALVASFPAGRITDRLGAARTLAGSQVLLAAGLVVAATASGTGVFMLGVAIAGMAYGAVNPATSVLVTFSVPRRRRALLMSVKQTGVTLGGLLGGSILPSVASASSWRVALLLPICGLAVTTTGAACLRRQERSGWFDERASPHALEPMPPGVVAPGPTPIGLYGFIMAGVQLSFVGYLAVYLVDEQGFTPTEAGFALALGFAAGSVGRIAWGAVSDRWFRSHATTLALAAGGSVAGLLAVTLGARGLLLWMSIALVGLCSVGWNGVFLALIADGSRAGELGRATARTLAWLHAGVVLLPPLLGVLHGTAGLSWSVVWACASALTLGAFVLISRAPRRPVSGTVAERAALAVK
jgi:MFS family permease